MHWQSISTMGAMTSGKNKALFNVAKSVKKLEEKNNKSNPTVSEDLSQEPLSKEVPKEPPPSYAAEDKALFTVVSSIKRAGEKEDLPSEDRSDVVSQIKEEVLSDNKILEEKEELPAEPHSSDNSDLINKLINIIIDFKEEIDNDIRQTQQNLGADIAVVEQRQNLYKETYRIDVVSQIKEEVLEEVLSDVQRILSGDVANNIKRLEEKIDIIRDGYKQTLNEGLLNIPPNVKNSDPLTPLDQNFVTLAQLNDHYRLFLNRVQTQLATIGGGGSVELQYLEDLNVGIATNISAYDGYYLQVDVNQTGNDENKKFKFSPLSVAGVTTFSSTVTFDGPIDANSNIDVAGVSTLSGNIKSNGKLTINPEDGSTTWQRELDTIHQIRDDIYLQSTLNVGDKAGFDFTPLAISAFSYSGTTLTLTTAAHAIKVGANVLIKDSASGFSEAFNTISGTTGTTIKVTRSSDPSSSLSTANTKVTVYTPVDPRGCINVAKDHDKFDENSFNPILRGFVGRDLDTTAGVNTEAFKLELKKDSSAADHVATLLHSTREFGAGQRIALTIDDGESYPDGKNLVLTQGGVKITADDSAFTDSDELLEVEGNAEIDGTLIVGGAINVIGLSTFRNGLNLIGLLQTNDDVSFTGDSYNVSWDKSTNSLEFSDNAKATFGAGNDLEIHSNGTTGVVGGAVSFTSDITVGTSQAQGVVLTSPNGTKYRLVVANDGTLSTSAV